MRVLLISANTEPINMPVVPVGLGAVAAATEDAGHEVKLLDLMSVREPELVTRDAAASVGPDVIGISVRNVDDQNMEDPCFLLGRVKEVITSCRKASRAPIVLGGAGYSMFPEPALSYLGGDMGIQGEGELAFPALLSLLEQNADLSEAPGLYLPGLGLQGRRKQTKHLDSLPLPAARLWHPSAAGDSELWMPIQTRRGCPMNCSYCATSTIEGRIIRKRSPALVVDWIESHVEAGFKRFYFTDSLFNIPPSYARQLCDTLAKRELDIAWRCIIYPGRINEALVQAMAKAGCTEVALGFESGSEAILRLMNKRFLPGHIRRASQMFAGQGIRRMGFLMLGGPGETRRSVEESLHFADSLHMDVMKVTFGVRIYPGTALARRALAEGRITPGDDLLFPRFYMVDELEDWLAATVADWMVGRPHWVM